MDILEKIVTKKKIYLENTKQKVSYKTLRSNVEHSFGNRKVISFIMRSRIMKRYQ